LPLLYFLLLLLYLLHLLLLLFEDPCAFPTSPTRSTLHGISDLIVSHPLQAPNNLFSTNNENDDDDDDDDDDNNNNNNNDNNNNHSNNNINNYNNYNNNNNNSNSNHNNNNSNNNNSSSCNSSNSSNSNIRHNYEHNNDLEGIQRYDELNPSLPHRPGNEEDGVGVEVDSRAVVRPKRPASVLKEDFWSGPLPAELPSPHDLDNPDNPDKPPGPALEQAGFSDVAAATGWVRARRRSFVRSFCFPQPRVFFSSRYRFIPLSIYSHNISLFIY
jgi:hypothetical protein